MPDGDSKQSLRQIFLAAFAGSLGTIFAGILLSSGSLKLIQSILHSNELPKDAVIFVNSKDCIGAGADWVAMDLIGGHFIVAANTEWPATRDKNGVTSIILKSENLPNIRADNYFIEGGITAHDYLGGEPFVLSIGEDKNKGGLRKDLKIDFKGQSIPIPVSPPSFALTACQKKS